ncbi:PH domain-containing protein [Agromyces sp. CFH 90414]|uniref:PH domain-containing protein n=1 Tax=Agromyces agglutinans TaxID=2662258 RepID=A0A6I2F508_9MICO|nr:PH domain-containing protein [Agromyces agglutinans]MRG60535.1 PH domain-containing protein [Agromyces agglutinans]
MARLRRHGRVLILPALLFIAVAGGTAYAVAWFPDLWQRVAVASAALLIVLLGCLLPFLAWLTRRTTVTTRRIIERSGVFVRVRRELLLTRGYDLTVRQTPGQRMFGSGDVRINTGHDRPFVLRDVPRPAMVQAALNELMGSTQSIIAEHRRAEQSIGEGDTVVWGTR